MTSSYEDNATFSVEELHRQALGESPLPLTEGELRQMREEREVEDDDFRSFWGDRNEFGERL